MSNPETEPHPLQAPTDRLYIPRAPHLMYPEKDKSLKARIGRRVLSAVELDARLPGHPTFIENYFFEADLDKTDAAVTRFETGIANIDEISDMFWDHVLQESVADSDTIIVATPHTDLFDIQAMAYLSQTGDIGRGRSPRDNYLYLGRMLAYTDFRVLPVLGKKRNIALDLILPVTNFAQVYPYSKSTEEFHEEYGHKAQRANVKASLAVKRDIKGRKSEEKIIYFVAPTATRIRGRVMPRISNESMKLLKSMHEEGVPIITAGLGLDIIRAFVLSKIPGIDKPAAQFIPGEVVTAEEDFSASKIHNHLVEVAQSVTKQAVRLAN